MSSVPFDLDGFEPVRRLGGGGFGDVWLARQTNIDRDVAIKVGHAPIDDKTVQMRFERECIALGRLSGHPNIIEVFTAGRLDDGRPYLVLELVAGGTLWDRLQRGQVPEPALRAIGVQLADALGVAHAAGVLHRDLKPENVLLRPNGEAVLGDFGIARLHDGANTTSHAITASVAYAAPEILSGQPASAASDVYGIGICLLAAVIQTVPFVHKTDESIHPIINRVLSDTPPDLRTRDLSAEFSEIVSRTLDKDPTRRPASADDLKRLIEGLDGKPSSGHPGPSEPHAARPTQALGSFPAPPAHSGPPPAAVVSGPTGPPQAHPGGHQGGPAGAGPAPLGFAAAGQPSGPYQGPGGPPPGFGQSHQHQPGYGPAPAPASSAGASSRVAVFTGAFAATVLVGGVALWAIINVTSEADDRSGGVTGATTIATTTTTVTVETLPSGPLVLPVTVTDIGFGANASSEPDLFGPASPQFCDNIPSTTGLNEWVGETITDAAGTPLFFQQLIRFETEEQASSFVASYSGTVDCTEWAVPIEDTGSDLIASPTIVTPAMIWADDTRAIEIAGEASAISFFSWFRVVRHSTDVYIANLTAFNQADVEDLDRVVGIAVGRLGY